MHRTSQDENSTGGRVLVLTHAEIPFSLFFVVDLHIFKQFIFRERASEAESFNPSTCNPDCLSQL